MESVEDGCTDDVYVLELDSEVQTEVYKDIIMLRHNMAMGTKLDHEPFWLLFIDKSTHMVKVVIIDF